MTVIKDNIVSPSLMATMNPSKESAKTGAAAAQDRFMTLLVTQMKNQDPLNPLDNAQVTSQLAQLSTVTGIDKLNTTLEGLMGSYQSSQALQAAGMIGHSVLTAGSSMTLSGGKGLFGIELTEPADQVEVTVRDSAGNSVDKFDLGAKDAGILPMMWDGQSESGEALPDGQYTFEVAATRSGKKIDGVTKLTVGDVMSVSTGSKGVTLNVPNVGSVNLADIRQIL